MREFPRYSISLNVDEKMLRARYPFKLADIIEVTEHYGDIRLKKAFMAEYSERSRDILKAATKNGFHIFHPPKFASKMITEVTQVICTRGRGRRDEGDSIDMIAVAGSDPGYVVLFEKAKEWGMDTLALLSEPFPSLERKSTYFRNMSGYMDWKERQERSNIRKKLT